MEDPHVPEERRFCRSCDERVGRSRGGQPGRPTGFCPRCGTPFSFVPKLRAGDLVGGQYEVAGCLAHGGMGWVYLARDKAVDDRWVVLKGLLQRGDDEVAAALAERRFLAGVKHPNIVRIHNFVEHDGDGYIVMEHVDGISLKGILDARRNANGGQPDPLPVEHAIAYCLEILPALGHLHDMRLAYCDLKPDNIMRTESSVVLIDLGGVYHLDDQTSPVFGTVGYQAPEVGTAGPTVASDLYTVGRTLAVLCTNFAGFQTVFRHSLPAPEDVPLYRRFDALFRLLQRATAPDARERFQNAADMAAQLVGVLREVVSTTTGTSSPATSTLFTAEVHSAVHEPDARSLPWPLVQPDDPHVAVMLSLAGARPDEIVARVDQIDVPTVDVELWAARTLIEAGRASDAAPYLDSATRRAADDWRTGWHRAVAALASRDVGASEPILRRVYQLLPGELAPKLALGVVAEMRGDLDEAARWYDIVSRTDPEFTSAAFGLARCRRAAGDDDGAMEAYRRVPDRSSAHVDARLAEVGILVDGAPVAEPGRLTRAARIVESLSLDRETRARLETAILGAALAALHAGAPTDASTTVLGVPLVERDVRLGLERAFRLLATTAASTSDRIGLVELANRVRPRTLL